MLIYWQTLLPSGREQNSTLPVQRSSLCTPIDDETICHRNSSASEITMKIVATMVVAGLNCPDLRAEFDSVLCFYDQAIAS